jgi:soluble lytic murein transglycosylase-like protein
LIITRASWEDRTPPAPDPWLAAEAPGQIRRYRDAKGVWHIHSVEPELPAPAIPKARPRSLLSQAFASTLPEKGGVWPNTAAPFSSGGQVVAYKDKKGKLIITNPDPQALAGRGPPLSPAPHLQAIILEAAQAYGLPPPLIEAVIKVESNAVPWAVSPKGAMGLMQLMPGTAEFLGVKDPFSPRENVLGGSHYLRLLLNLFQESLPLALAAYNAGFQRVINCGHRIPEIKETQEFVAQVMERYYLAAQRADRPRL